MAEARDLFAAPNERPDAQFMTTNQVARMFEVTPTTVRNWVRDGKLTCIKINGRIRIHRDSVLRLAHYNYGGRG